MPHATFPWPAQRAYADPCPHRVPSTLVPHLHKMTVCPPCTIQNSIHAIQQIQAELNARGGIYVSRPKKKKTADDAEWQAHLALRSRWRQAKIAALNDVMKFEELSKSEERGEGWDMLDQALAEWEREAENLAEVPGYAKEMSAEEVGDIVRRMMDELKNVLGGVIDPEENGDAAMSDTDSVEDEDVGDCPFPDSDVDTDSEEEDRMEVDKAMDSQSESETSEDDEDDHQNVEFTAEDIMEVEMTNPLASSTPTKGDIKTSRKRVRFTDFATICPDSLTFVPSLFPHNPYGFPEPSADYLPLNPHLLSTSTQLSKNVALQVHSRHTSSSHKRVKSRFKRSSSLYRPSRWASPAGYEKPDTGCFRMDWWEAEVHWLEQDREIREEKKVFDGLKRVSGTWMLMRLLQPALWSYEKTMRDWLGRGTPQNAH